MFHIHPQIHFSYLNIYGEVQYPSSESDKVSLLYCLTRNKIEINSGSYCTNDMSVDEQREN